MGKFQGKRSEKENSKLPADSKQSAKQVEGSAVQGPWNRIEITEIHTAWLFLQLAIISFFLTVVGHVCMFWVFMLI